MMHDMTLEEFTRLGFVFSGAEEPGSEPGGEPGGDAGFVSSDGTFSEGWANGDAFKEHADTLGRFKTVGDLAKSYTSARSKMGKDPESLIEIPGESASDEAKAAYRAKINAIKGVPETNDAYEYTMPEDLAAKIPAIEEDRLNKFKEFAHSELELNQAQFAKALDYYHNMIADDIGNAHTKFTEDSEKEIAEAKTALKQEWKSEYDSRVARSQAIMEKYGGAEAVEAFHADNNPLMVKFLDRIASAMSEDAIRELKGQDGGMLASNIKSQIADVRSQMDAIVKDNPVNYKINAKYKDLVAKKKHLYKQMPA